MEVEDSQGVPIYNDYSPVILSLVSSASGVLTSCVGNQSAGNGLVTFSGCLVNLNTGVNSATFSLQASDSSIISNAFFPSNTNFKVSASTAAPQLVFLNTPSPNASGTQMSNVSGQSYQFAVAVQQNGSTLTSWTGSLALTTSGSTGSINQLSGCSGMAAATNGVFKISGCTFIGGVSVVNGNAPIYYTMTATGTPSGQSASVNSGNEQRVRSDRSWGGDPARLFVSTHRRLFFVNSSPYCDIVGADRRRSTRLVGKYRHGRGWFGDADDQ